MSVCPWISLNRDTSLSCNMNTIYIQCHSNPVLFPPCKPHLYDGKVYGLKKKVYIWTSMDVVPAGCGMFFYIFRFKMWFFHFITGVIFS